MVSWPAEIEREEVVHELLRRPWRAPIRDRARRQAMQQVVGIRDAAARQGASPPRRAASASRRTRAPCRAAGTTSERSAARKSMSQPPLRCRARIDRCMASLATTGPRKAAAWPEMTSKVARVMSSSTDCTAGLFAASARAFRARRERKRERMRRGSAAGTSARKPAAAISSPRPRW